MTNYIDEYINERFHVIIRRDEEFCNLGGVAYLIDGQMIGDLHQTGDLRVPLSHWKTYHAVPRQLGLVREMSAARAWNFCYCQLYDDAVEYDKIVVPVEIDVASNYSECFDGFPVFLVSEEQTERIIWSTDRGLTTGECRLPIGTYEKTVLQVLHTLRDLV